MTGARYSNKVRARALELGLAEMPRYLIQQELGVERSTLNRWLREARKNGMGIRDLRFYDKGERDYPKVVRLRADVAVVIEEEAKNRNFASSALFVNRLLEIMIDEPNLFDAILDGD